MQVPAERLWGAQTQRSLENFKIGGDRMPIELIHALAKVKRASAQVNLDLGKFKDPAVGRAIIDGGRRGDRRAGTTRSSPWSSGRPAAGPRRT